MFVNNSYFPAPETFNLHRSVNTSENVVASWLMIATLCHTILPSKYEIPVKYFPPIFDQGNIGSCTAQTIATVYGYNMLTMKPLYYQPISRLDLYYYSRLRLGKVDSDYGSDLATAFGAASSGMCAESLWEYDTTKMYTKSPALCDEDKFNHRATRYSRVNHDIDDMKCALARGLPIVAGIQMYESMSRLPSTGWILPLPGDKDPLIGGHAVVLVGYDDDRAIFKARSSWGTHFGDKGCFYIPYQYVLNTAWAFDFIVLTEINDKNTVITNASCYSKGLSLLMMLVCFSFHLFKN